VTLLYPSMATVQSETPQSPGRRYALLAFKLAVSIALLWFLFSRIDVGRLWTTARTASLPWLLIALAIYAVAVAASVWRWHLLLDAQRVHVDTNRLAGSYLVALFFNNFLPSNIGGDVVRIRDTARPAGSLTLAAAVVLVDRILGLMGLVLVAACGATVAAGAAGGAARAALPIVPAWLWAGFFIGAGLSAPAVLAPAGFGRMLQPLRVIHPEWVDSRIETITGVLARFRDRPTALAGCFSAAVFVQAATVVFYLAVAFALRIPISPWDLAVIVPLSFVIQMAPVSINGFGVREATFTLYFARLGLPIESALLVSLVPTALVMLFSLSGAAVYVGRRH
jgi:glycosyltransferase 2 family protein